MTMNTGIARALRRFVGASAIMIAGLTGIRHWISVEIQLPPAGVDRVVVRSPEGTSHEITDRAEVARIVRQVRSLMARALPVADRIGNPTMRVWGVAFHRGAEAHDEIGVANYAILAQGAIFLISPEQLLDLRRLLGAEESPASPAEGDRG